MTSTLLFVDGHPVAYTIQQEGGCVLLHPSHDFHPHVVPPHLSACWKEDHWEIEGCCCRDLKDQVLEDLEHLTPKEKKQGSKA